LKKEFVDIIAQNQGIIHKICNLYANNAEDKQDLFQDIVFQLWKAFPAFRGEAKISTWMYQVALNTAITGFKKSKRRVETQSMSEHIPEIPQNTHYEELEEKLRTLYEAINLLDTIEKAIIMLYLEDNSYQEIALIIGITESNVGVKINRIKAKLKKILAKQEIWS
jgi:RNA polymerase sigma factor (sigma-70 family)